MSDDILVLSEGKGDIDNLEARDLSAEQVVSFRQACMT